MKRKGNVPLGAVAISDWERGGAGLLVADIAKVASIALFLEFGGESTFFQLGIKQRRPTASVDA